MEMMGRDTTSLNPCCCRRIGAAYPESISGRTGRRSSSVERPASGLARPPHVHKEETTAGRIRGDRVSPLRGAAGRPDPGGQPRPHRGCREVRPRVQPQVLLLHRVAYPQGDPDGRGRLGTRRVRGRRERAKCLGHRGAPDGAGQDKGDRGSDVPARPPRHRAPLLASTGASRPGSRNSPSSWASPGKRSASYSTDPWGCLSRATQHAASLYGTKEPGPFWASPTTTSTPIEMSMKAHPASRVLLMPTNTGKSTQAASIVTKNAASAPAIALPTTENSNKPTPANRSASLNRPPRCAPSSSPEADRNRASPRSRARPPRISFNRLPAPWAIPMALPDAYPPSGCPPGSTGGAPPVPSKPATFGPRSGSGSPSLSTLPRTGYQVSNPWLPARSHISYQRSKSHFTTQNLLCLHLRSCLLF